MATRDYRDLIVWQRAMELLTESHALAQLLPGEGRGMASQIRRSAESIPAHIAEGHSRASRAAFLYFLNVAYGSAKELQSHLSAAVAVGYVTEERAATAFGFVSEVTRMLIAMEQSLSGRGC